MYKKNRKQWLVFSKANLRRFPNRKERYKAFLRECYPPQKGYPYEKLNAVKLKLNLAIPTSRLVEYGNECNWLTTEGEPFKNIYTFCTVWNGVWLDEKRRNYFKNGPETDYQTKFLFDKMNYEQQQMNNAFLNSMELE